MKSERGEYELVSKQGVGGFGITWRAKDLADGSDVVVKVLRLERMDEWKSMDLFEREARALQRLDHPDIPAFVDYFPLDDGSSLALVQRFVEGRSLQACIDAAQRFDDSAIERMLRGLLEVLVYLHGLNPPVIHRDIKPGNVIVRPDGGVSLVDFGAITERLRPETVGGSTQVGTVGYMPMEQMVGKAVPASDLYAVGMTMLAAATGVGPDELPYEAESGRVDVFGATPSLAGAPRGLLRELTAPGVGLRPGSALEALRLLDDHDHGFATRQPAASAAVPVRSGYPTHPRLWTGLIAVGAAGAVAMYGPLFDLLSETTLKWSWGIWGFPVLYGLIGRGLEGNRPDLDHIPRRAGVGAAIAVAVVTSVIYGAMG